MRHRPRVASALAALIAAVLASLALSVPTAGATTCGKKVVDDWSDNSRIDGIYPLRCYQEGIDAIPPDILDYTNAADVISRAFQGRTGRRLAIRESGKNSSQERTTTPPLVDTSSSSTVPIPLLVLGGMALALLAAGGLGYFRRRRHAVDDEES
jgi:LPXTG-motif cell wall-anchored protein